MYGGPLAARMMLDRHVEPCRTAQQQLDQHPFRKLSDHAPGLIDNNDQPQMSTPHLLDGLPQSRVRADCDDLAQIQIGDPFVEDTLP